jgi:hypothetical protein
MTTLITLTIAGIYNSDAIVITPNLFFQYQNFCNEIELGMGDIGPFRPVLQEGLHLLDDLIRQRAVDEDQTPLLAYPKPKLGITDYEFFTGRKLNRLVDGAAKALIKRGIKSVVCTPLSTRSNLMYPSSMKRPQLESMETPTLTTSSQFLV